MKAVNECAQRELLVGAGAALLVLEVERVHGLDEGWGVCARVGVALLVGLHDSHFHRGGTARAALLLLTRRLLALQLALGLLAVGGLHALVVALELLADRRALGLGRGAGGVALGGSTHSLALGAVFLLAVVLGAPDGAHRALAVNNALGALGL